MNLPDNTLLQGGKYKIVRFIGSGGFGCTYEAKHVMLRKRVAIKEFFVKDFCNRDENSAHVTLGIFGKKALVDKLRGKFIDEARALSRLQHPHIVCVTDVFEENGTAYFVMDYVDGLSLSEIVQRDGPLPEEKTLKYIRQVAEALKYVHAHNRLHLDVKPGNILINEHDDAVLIDFGASKQYDEVNGENTSTLMGKTPGYAPPEQMGNDVVKFTPATDIYALGATLYKLLTGITPPSATLLISGEDLDPLPLSISDNVKATITAAMQLNKRERTQSIAEFLEMLGNVITEESVEEATILDCQKLNETQVKAEHVSVVKEGIKKHSSLKRIFTIVACALFVLVIGIIVVLQVKGSSTIQSSEDSISNGKINGHEFVDLGLSVKWAKCNVGASLQSDYGEYFAWGETIIKSEYTEDNSETYDVEMDDISGDSWYDVACALWGSTWRIPSKEEIDELVDKCQWVSSMEGGHKGYKVTGPNGNSIFLPAAGRREDSTFFGVDKYGLYWGSTPHRHSTTAYSLYFCVDGGFWGSWDGRNRGFNVRPVSE